MKKIAIWGAGEFGNYVYKKLSGRYADVIAFIDNNFTLKREIPVFSGAKFVELLYDKVDEVWLANSNYYAMDDIVNQMHELGIEKVWVVDPFVWKTKKDFIVNTKDCYLIELRDKAILNKLEFHVADHCNLNCVGCSHFSPSFPVQYADISAFRSMVSRLKELFANIFQFRLMGGEPFLNKDLDKYITTVRRYFPNTHLTIVTNGLLYKKVNSHIWDCIKENEAFVQISLYKPTAKIKDEIEKFLKEKDIPFSFGSGLEQYNDEGIIEDFHKCLTLDKIHDKNKAAVQCFGSRCHYLRDGKISKCAYPQLIGHINAVFGTEFIVEAEDVVDIFNSEMEPWEIVSSLKKPIPFCEYCTEEFPVRYKWSVNNKETDCIENYIV